LRGRVGFLHLPYWFGHTVSYQTSWYASNTKLLTGSKKPVHLVLDSLPGHKKANVREYVASTNGRLTLHFLPGYAPDLNPDELVWSHVKRTGAARRPLQKGEKLRDKIQEQLAKLQQMPRLVRSFFKAPSVAYIGDC
jgi:transposase